MESELGALIESLRTGSNRLNADLQLLEGNLDRGQERGRRRGRSSSPSPSRRPSCEPAVEPPVAPARPPSSSSSPSRSRASTPAVEATPTACRRARDRGADEGGDDIEGARLIALNMALNGTPREETDRYLAENFELVDRRGLLDEVYACVDG